MPTNCKKCNKEFVKKNVEIKRTANNFCSRQCFSEFKLLGKPRKEYICLKCKNNFYKTYDHKLKTFCKDCSLSNYSDTKTSYYKSRTLDDIYNHHSVKDKHPSWKSSFIRLMNRTWNANLLAMPCNHCGYDLHVELAHIKAISTFPSSATLEEVNHPNNIIPLCPNCHWLFDNGDKM